MTEELSSVQPNPYLFNIEHGRKRKARLGHEIGAGARCRKCEDKCPGFELHFWRKICQNCRCSKDDHEVEDDDEDIGQFVIGKLFNRPPRTKKDEMEFVHGTDLEMINENTGKAEKIKFDWLPPGVEKSMASRYMERLPVEKRPIAGTDAAKNRKKLLENQFPIYDMDEESRSHNLPQEDLQSFQEYVERIKTQVAGQGLVQEIQAVLPEHAQMLQSSPSYGSYGMNAGEQGGPGIPGDGLISDASSDSSGIVPDISVTKPWSPVRGVSDGMYDASVDPLYGAKNASGSVLPRSPGLTRAGARTPELGAQSTGLIGSSPSRSPGKTGYVSPYVSPYKLPTVTNSPSKFGSVPGVSRISGAAAFASGLLGPKPFVPYAAGGSVEADPKGTAAGFSAIGSHYGGIGSHGSGPGMTSNISGVSGLPGMNPGSESMEGGTVGDPGVLVGDLGALSDTAGAPGTLPTETGHSGFNPSEGANLYGQDSTSSSGPVPGDIYRTRNVVYDSRITDQSGKGVPYAGTGLPQGSRVMPGRPGSVPAGQSGISGSQTGPGTISGGHGSVLGRPGTMSGGSGGRGSDAEYTGAVGVPSETYGGHRSQLPGTLGSAGDPGSEIIYGNIPGAGNIPDLSSEMTAMNLDASQSGALATQAHPSQPGIQPVGGVLPSMIPQGGRRIGDVKMVDAVQAPYGASMETLASSSSLAPGSNVNVQLPGESRVLSRSPGKTNTPHHNSKFSCQYCELVLKTGDVAVFAERAGGDKCWHPECFVCVTCKDLLADLIYFYQDGKVYCGRHFTDAANMARCKACDELIFGNSWTRADGFDWHLDHFCCYMCDTPLAGQRYVPDQQGQSYCLPCYMSYRSKTCEACEEKISPEMNRCGHRGYFYHATPQCFKCYTCKDDLLGKRFKMSKNWVFCTQECIQSAADALARNLNPKERLA